MGNKTEKPTDKRLRDSAKKGQMLKSKDFTISCLLLCGVFFLAYFLNIEKLTDILLELFRRNFEMTLEDYIRAVFMAAGWAVLPFILLCIVVTMLSTWLQTRFTLATEALRIRFEALNPVEGFKKIFSLRTVKELVMTLLHLTVISFAGWFFWINHREALFVTLNMKAGALLSLWGELIFKLTLYCLGSVIIVMVLDLILEYLLFMKDMKMDKQEVKQDQKEQEGSPEIKSKRRSLREEFLSEQMQSDISNSRLIIANPTHIAIGIYFKPEISPIPLISIRESNQKALAVRRYAEKIGVPVIRDIPLARRIFATHRRYDFVSLEEIDAVLRLLIWLEEVELARIPDREKSILLPNEDGILPPFESETKDDETLLEEKNMKDHQDVS